MRQKRIDWNKIENFVRPLYENKDIMHNFSHIQRIQKKIKILKKQYTLLDKDLLNFLVYFHGLKKWVKQNKKKFLSFDIKKEYIQSLIRPSDIPTKKEEKIVCDANMLENVGTFGIKKSKVLAKYYNQSLEETLSLAKKSQKNYKFYTPLGKKLGKKGLEIKQKWIKQMEKELK
jgi:uncharacterized protein